MSASVASPNDLKTILCLTSLCAVYSPWSVQLIDKLGQVWNLPEGSRHGAVTLLYNPSAAEVASSKNNSNQDVINNTTSMLERAEKMAVSLRTTLQPAQAIEGWILVFYTCLRGAEMTQMKNLNSDAVSSTNVLRYDARVSVLLRRLAFLLRIKLSAVAALEEIALIDLQRETLQQQLQQEQKDVQENSNTSVGYWGRYVKIGATAMAAGGLLAVTGGLAAPALASGLATLGVASTSLVTTATVATLCGAGGAGLGAYKMSKRTRGLTYFELKQVNSKQDEYTNNGMTVYVCVSGFLRTQANVNNNSNNATSPTVATADSTTIDGVSEANLESPDFYIPWGCTFSSSNNPNKNNSTINDKDDEHKIHRQFLQLGLKLLDTVVTPEKANNHNNNDSNAVMNFDGNDLSVIIDTNKSWVDVCLDVDEPSNLNPSDDEDNDSNVNSNVDAEKVLSQMEEQLQSSQKSGGDDSKDVQDGVEMLDLNKTKPNELLTSAQETTSTSSEQSQSVLIQREYDWRTSVARYGDQFTLLWEPDILFQIGSSVHNLIKEGVKKGVSTGLQYTALNAVLSAIAFPMTLANLIASLDESWTMAVEAADQAGKVLADALISDAHGDRPVVLIGYSVGGRVVASCLSELAAIATGNASSSKGPKTMLFDSTDELKVLETLTMRIELEHDLDSKERSRRLRAATVVRDAVIIGTPCDTSSTQWMRRRSVVLGRLINVYNPMDWVLAFLYRYKRWSVLALAGLQQVKLPKENSHLVLPIENYNISKLIGGHNDYANKMPDILAHIGIGDVEDKDNHLYRYFLTN